MRARPWTLLFVLVFLGLSGSMALAHDGPVATGRGTVLFEPRVPLAGQSTVIVVRPTADDDHALTGGTLTGTFAHIGTGSQKLAFLEAEPGVYQATTTFTGKEWHGSLSYNSGETRITTDFGFTVFDPGNTIGAVEVRKLDWRAAGKTAAPPWTDTATWVLLIVVPIAVAAVLWVKQRAGQPTDTLLQDGTRLVPAGLMTLALLGSLAAPWSGYWDIAWHIDQGRDGLFSPPHMGIYGGILMTLLAVSIGVRSTGGLKRLRQFPALAFTIAAMIVELGSAPLDELWHRMMGLDISVWAPPHDMLIFGGGLAMIGLAAIDAAADPTGRDRFARLRIIGFGAAAMAVLNTFLAEFEFKAISFWHVSQTRPPVLYPTLLTLMAAATLIPIARLTRLPWAATQAAILFWVFRTGELLFFHPAMGRTVPRLPALVVVAGAIAADLVLQSKFLRGRYRYALSGAAMATVSFVLYQPLSLVLPVQEVAAAQLLAWSPLAVIVAASTGYLAGWLGDFVLRPQVESKQSYSA